jgi:hypothetical protein
VLLGKSATEPREYNGLNSAQKQSCLNGDYKERDGLWVMERTFRHNRIRKESAERYPKALDNADKYESSKFLSQD